MNKDLLTSLSSMVSDFAKNHLTEESLRKKLIEKNPKLDFYLKGQLPANEAKECEAWLNKIEQKMLGMVDKLSPIPFNIKANVSKIFASLKRTARERAAEGVEPTLDISPLNAWRMDCSKLPTNGYEGLTVLMESLGSLKEQKTSDERELVVICENVPVALRAEFKQWQDIAEKQLGIKLFN